MTQQQTENATKWLHTIHFNNIKPFLSNRLKKLRPPQDTHVSFLFFIITRKFGNNEKTKNAAKWLHTINVNEIEQFRRLLFVVSHENNNRQLNDGLYYRISELRDRTYSSLSHRSYELFSLEFLRQ